MVRKILVVSALACAMLFSAGCHHKVQNPLANIDSKQPDKGLYDRAIDSMKHGRYQEARTLLETLINTYPDSEYIARAKLAVGDSWYQEGGTAAWQQAEVEYKDFQTFFPNLPESSEAQLKVANIHYRQMEKPDRDFAQAQRAADEYKTLIQTYPDSPLVPEAKQRLREVQEILAERQFRIAHFYFLRGNMAASQARLQSLADSYPLYSNIDEALFELGELYEKEAVAMRKQNIPEATKEKLASDFQRHAVEAYSRIVSRYPAMDRAGDAKRKLQELNAPIPTPTAEALAESKAEEDSRRNVSMMQGFMGGFKKHPQVAKAAKVGDPSLEEEKVVGAPQMVRQLESELNVATTASPNEKVGIETVTGVAGKAPGPNQPPPGTQPAASTNAAPANAAPATEGAPPPTPPAQVNEVHAQQQAGAQAQSADPQSNAAAGQQGTTASATSTDPKSADKADKKKESTSKKKKKKGLAKLNPF